MVIGLSVNHSSAKSSILYGRTAGGQPGLMAVGIMQGADIIRVHDVKESKRLAQIVDQVVR